MNKKEDVALVISSLLFTLFFFCYPSSVFAIAINTNGIVNSITNNISNSISSRISSGISGLFSGGGGSSSGIGASGGFGKSANGGGGNIFGGKITAMWPCTCGPSIVSVTIGPPKGGVFILTPAVKLHANGKPVPGAWVIGDYSTVGFCPMWYGKFCVPVPTQGTITRIGTS